LGDFSALFQAATKHAQEVDTEQNSHNGNWWKIHEAWMFALGSVKDLVMEELVGGALVLYLTGFLLRVVIAGMNSSG
jgi:hypothetical protein